MKTTLLVMLYFSAFTKTTDTSNKNKKMPYDFERVEQSLRQIGAS